MNRRALLGLFVGGLVVRGTSRARADCAGPPGLFAELVSDVRRPLPRDGALLASFLTDYGGGGGRPRVVREGRRATLDASPWFVSDGRAIGCAVRYLGAGLFRLVPAGTFAEGPLELAGFGAQAAASPTRSLTVAGVMPAPLASVEPTSGQQGERRGTRSRWGTSTIHTASIRLAAPVPAGTHAVFFEARDGRVAPFAHTVGGRELTFEAVVGGTHCGDVLPLYDVLPSEGLEGRVVLVDTFGRTSRSRRSIALR